MLDRQNLRRRHERGLRAVLDGNHRGFEHDHGFSAADVALQEPIHRRGLFQIGDDFREHAFLCFRWFERQDAF